MIFGSEFGCVVLYWHLICKLIANSVIWTSHFLNYFMLLLDFEFLVCDFVVYPTIRVPCLLVTDSASLHHEFCF
jgi:hypothetical protein